MNESLTIQNISKKTGLPLSRIRYLEARFPQIITKKFFTEDGGCYSFNDVYKFNQIDHDLKSNTSSFNALSKRTIPLNRGKLLVFASGKGGVGKTSLSVNLSVIASALGNQITLLDGDMGMANAHILLGVRPQKNLESFFSDNLALKEFMIDTHQGLKLIPASSGVFDLANLNDAHLKHLSFEIQSILHLSDFLVIDCPAGIGKAVLNWISASHELIIVTTPSPTALLDAYGLIKVSVKKGFTSSIKVIVNLVNTNTEGRKCFDSLNQCCKKFLNLSLTFLGSVRKDSQIEKALIAKTPLYSLQQKSIVLSQLKKIAERLFTKGKTYESI